jgi:hypothetical protein
LPALARRRAPWITFIAESGEEEERERKKAASV